MITQKIDSDRAAGKKNYVVVIGSRDASISD